MEICPRHEREVDWVEKSPGQKLNTDMLGADRREI